MTDLEERLKVIRAEVAALAERVRLDATATRFLEGNHEIREGDAFLAWGQDPTRLSNVNSEGRWTYGSIEYHHTNPAWHKRLYTIEEVAEIVAKVNKT